MPRSILVCGYYDRQNFGDDAFVEVFRRLWGWQRLTFANLELVTPDQVRAAELIVLGGGNLLGTYFMQKVVARILPYRNCPLYAVGVSLPFPSIVETGALDMIDQFWCRAQADLELLRARFGAAVVHAIPDLALAYPLPKALPAFSTRTKVGFCLSRSLVKGNEKALVSQLRHLVERVITLGYEPYWLAFNTDTAEHESDVVLYQLLPLETRRRMPLYSGTRLLPALAQMDVLIASRFHAHVFGFRYQKPVVSLVLTRKVQQWNHDHQLTRMEVSLPRKCEQCTPDQRLCAGCLNFLGAPTLIPLNEVINKLRSAYLPSGSLMKREKTELERIMRGLMTAEWQQRKIAPYYISPTLLQDTISKLAPLVASNRDPSFTAAAICYQITGRTDHPFHYGLTQALAEDKFDLTETTKYLLSTYHREESQWSRGLVSRPTGLFSLTKIPPYRLEGQHRAGWAYVMELLGAHHREDGVLLDAFVDRTFGWDAPYAAAVGQIPYREPWVGVLHHPAEAVYSTNDCSHLFMEELFIRSLEHCRGLIVMASDLKTWLEYQLFARQLQVPVHVIYHPTPLSELKFKWRYFASQNTPLIVQIGAWLRDPTAIFQLPTIPGYQKAILRCTGSDGYLSAGPPRLIPDTPCPASGACRDSSGSDPWTASGNEWLEHQWKTVQILEHLSNEAYDELLTRSIVLLPLKKAVAVNTLLECLVRRTPVLVPLLPAVIEYLGIEYPFYFKSYDEIPALVLDRARVKAASRYLKGLDLTRFTARHFHDQLEKLFS